uniref:Uncharacterized protein n=1 Tax=Solanum tuberosum TaxID=4113 RepID=M0ZSR2_SOLTU
MNRYTRLTNIIKWLGLAVNHIQLRGMLIFWAECYRSVKLLFHHKGTFTTAPTHCTWIGRYLQKDSKHAQKRLDEKPRGTSRK